MRTKTILGLALCLSVVVTCMFCSVRVAAQEEGLAAPAEAAAETLGTTLVPQAEAFLSAIVKALTSVLFYKIPNENGVPFLIFWLMVGGIFFTLRLGFVNIRMFRHAIDVARGKYTPKDAPGQVTHAQALAAAVSATVGLGNIAGVAIAVTIGGPGAVLWMVLFGFLGMSTKCAEVIVGQKYRRIDSKGKVSGGAFYYLTDGLAKKNLPVLGKVLAVFFAVCCVGAALGGGNMFQANQAVSILTETYTTLEKGDWIIALALAVSVGVVLIGGIRRIAVVASGVVPFMAFLYISCALIVIIVNYQNIPEALTAMFQSAVGGVAAAGGLLGAIIAGAQRAAFSNEAGMGSAPIAHATAKSDDPVKEGCVALLEPFIDTVVICFMTGLMITITGVYKDSSVGDGVLLTSAAFRTVSDWFPVLLSVVVVLFAYSTMITWSYYGEKAWQYLFGKNKRVANIYHILFLTATFFGGIVNLGIVIDFSDVLFFSMAIPNLIGLYILSDEIAHDLRVYRHKLKQGKIKRVV